MKKKPNPKPTIDDECIICETPYAATHEPFFGRNGNPRKCQDDGICVKLCYNHHQSNSKEFKGVHFNGVLDLQIKQQAQAKYEETHTRAEFMARYGQNWL